MVVDWLLIFALFRVFLSRGIVIPSIFYHCREVSADHAHFLQKRLLFHFQQFLFFFLTLLYQVAQKSKGFKLDS
ncbi:MAG TPA: hypothetical protein PKW79_08070, partial [Rhabdochlamydiaceae bacterium]|nr:hypothetical protein [Rhabdochlamydiaceae bacterium]